MGYISSMLPVDAEPTASSMVGEHAEAQTVSARESPMVETSASPISARVRRRMMSI